MYATIRECGLCTLDSQQLTAKCLKYWFTIVARHRNGVVDGSLIFLQVGQRYVLLSPGQGCVGVYHLRLVANHQWQYTCMVYCNILQFPGSACYFSSLVLNDRKTPFCLSNLVDLKQSTGLSWLWYSYNKQNHFVCNKPLTQCKADIFLARTLSLLIWCGGYICWKLVELSSKSYWKIILNLLLKTKS